MKAYKWLKASPYGVFLVVRPRMIGLFILIWNILLGATMISAWCFGPVGEAVGLLLFFLVGLYTTVVAVTPFISQEYRARWCRPGTNFADARFGLIFLGILGCMFLFQSLVWVFQTYLRS